MKRILLSFAILLAGFAAYGGYFIHRVYYGVRVYETVAPKLPDDLKPPAILIFSKTNGYRHEEAIPAANRALTQITKTEGWSVFLTENAAIFNATDLSRFKATVWNNTSGDVLNADQKKAFRAFIENGAGFVGIHGAGGDPRYEWRWYVETLLGAEFKGHPLKPQFQRATIRVENTKREWSRVDEWYSFEKSPRGAVQVLATLDERTYQPKMFWEDLRMGADHPIIWRHSVGKGRAFYSALGHAASAYEEPEHLQELRDGIAWAAALSSGDRPDNQ